MNIKKIEINAKTIIENKGFKLFSIRTKKEFGEDVLEILVDGEKLDSDILESINLELVSSLGDDDLLDHYFLEVSSVGIERPIRNLEEMVKAIDQFIYLEAKAYQGNATLLEITDQQLKLQINIKGKIKKITVPYDEVTLARYAVKF